MYLYLRVLSHDCLQTMLFWQSLSLAEEGYIKVNGTTELISYDTFLCFGLSTSALPRRSAPLRLFSTVPQQEFVCLILPELNEFCPDLLGSNMHIVAVDHM